MKRFRITVNGKAYEVEAEVLSDLKPSSSMPTAESAKIHAAEVAPVAKKPTPPPTAAKGSGDVTSPLAGKVVSVDAQAGQKVTEGQRVLTLEAMKMNTFVVAPREGVVKEILVTIGQAVEEGATLLRLE